MDEDNLGFAESVVNATYIRQGGQNLRGTRKALRELLCNRTLPKIGWQEYRIEKVLQDIAEMDSNNFEGQVGAGEREGRVLCPLVSRRHFRLAHGIGRSGDVAAVQPKAAGSSLLYKLTNALVLSALRLAGLTRMKQAVVLPMATGMSLALAYRSLAPERRGARYIIWSRIDQKSCFKSMYTAGFEAIVVEGQVVEDEIRTDVEGIRKAIEDVGVDAVLCVATTTSCFAPRASDDVVAIARVCKELDIPHVVNHAYGIQVSKLNHELNNACMAGRVDVCVSSVDKNFLVPVGGAVIASPLAEVCDRITQTYAGRASASSVVDVFCTLLYLGERRWKELLTNRRDRMKLLRMRMEAIAEASGGRVLKTPTNPVGYAEEAPPCQV